MKGRMVAKEDEVETSEKKKKLTKKLFIKVAAAFELSHLFPERDK